MRDGKNLIGENPLFLQSMRGLADSSLEKDPWVGRKLASDMVHMQVNRIFAFRQRRHEAFIWHSLLKLVVTAEKCG
ncbi:hypothetical protein SNE25_08860 [Mucilaginibacter sabulilitoris]|uniref:Uncharacterized protein n=1 Tax=Mucilaginibacter sabulilitoris TaxID=1173583 RepID=A0ABZ0TR83_9SPHI|nr:hypothetical protein [Mucilaginibacter sabulilitoris]WPU95627.1 hypothetical protein SNE25_08860 [Mucilaginibacter sabulilitoris]